MPSDMADAKFVNRALQIHLLLLFVGCGALVKLRPDWALPAFLSGLLMTMNLAAFQWMIKRMAMGQFSAGRLLAAFGLKMILLLGAVSALLVVFEETISGVLMGLLTLVISLMISGFGQLVFHKPQGVGQS